MVSGRRDKKLFGAVRLGRIGDLEFQFTPCAYCGYPATDTEHVTPKSLSATAHELGIMHYGQQYTVPSCRECNSIAGKKLFICVTEKRAYIQKRLAGKYKKLLRLPDWTEGDMDGMADNLKGMIRRSMAHKRMIERRLRWKSSQTPGSVHSVRRDFLRSDIGSGSVQKPAETSITSGRDATPWRSSGRPLWPPEVLRAASKRRAPLKPITLAEKRRVILLLRAKGVPSGSHELVRTRAAQRKKTNGGEAFPTFED